MFRPARAALAPALALTIVPFAIGCGSDSEPADPPDSDAGTALLPLPPIPGGGTTGGSLLGRIVVHVLTGGVGAPQTTVAIDTAEGRWVAITDDDGRAEIIDPALRGPAVVTAFQSGAAHYTLAGADAAGVSLELDPQAGPPAAEAFAEGDLSGWSQLSSPSPGETLYGEVRPIVRSVLAPSFEWTQRLRPGTDVPQNVVTPSLSSFAVRLDVANATGLFARAGRQTGTTVSFEYVALASELAFTEGATTTANLALQIPLSNTANVDASERPAGLTLSLQPVIRLGDDGLVDFIGPIALASDAITFSAPDLSSIPEASLAAYARATDPAGQQSVRWFSIRGTTALPAFLPIPTPRRSGARTTQTESRPADLVQWTLFRDGVTAWRIDAVGPARDAPLVWPTPPEGFEDPLGGARFVSVSSLDFGGIDPDRVRFGDLDELLNGVAVGFAVLEL